MAVAVRVELDELDLLVDDSDLVELDELRVVDVCERLVPVPRVDDSELELDILMHHELLALEVAWR